MHTTRVCVCFKYRILRDTTRMTVAGFVLQEVRVHHVALVCCCLAPLLECLPRARELLFWDEAPRRSCEGYLLKKAPDI